LEKEMRKIENVKMGNCAIVPDPLYSCL